MNSRTRRVIDQAERIAIGVMNTVSRIRNRLMPSTPMRYCTASPVSQGTVSTNWKPAMARVERGPEIDAQRQDHEAGPECGEAGVARHRRLVAAQRGEVEHADQRQEGDERKDRETGLVHVSGPTGRG